MEHFRIRKGILLICMQLSVMSFCANAQVLTLQDLVDSAKRNSPLLKQKYALSESAKANLDFTKHSFLPSLRFSEQINIGTDNSIAGSLFSFGVTPTSSGGIRPENTLQAATGNIAVLYSEYELWNFGLNNAKISNANALIQIQEADIKKETFYLEGLVAKYFFGLLKSQYKLEADLQNVNRYDSIFKVIKALTSSGLKPGSDSSLAKAELSKAKIGYNQTMGVLSQLKQEISFITGVSINSLSKDKLATTFLTKDDMIYLDVVGSISNPWLEYYKSRLNLLQTQNDLIKKSYRPKIILAGSMWARGSSIQYNDSFKSLETGLGYQRFNYAIGLAFSYNLFNGLFKNDKIRSNKLEIKAGEYELEQQIQFVNNSTKQANTALTTIQKNLLELPIQLTAARETYQQKMAQYKAGIISLVDLTNASFVLYRSQTDYLETMSDNYVAKLAKAMAIGNLDQFIQTIK